MTPETERLAAHAADLLARAQKGEITHTPFLTPFEQKTLARAFAFAAPAWLFWGGYAAAERKRLFFLPDYVVEADEPTRALLLADPFSETLAAVRVSGSGYRDLTHRDVLGAALHLGIERDALGDVCMLSPAEAVLFCDARMAAFLTENLCRAANDAVRTERFSPPADFDGGRKFRALSCTVASPRADAVVAALCNLSRERAQALFREGRVEIDYECAEKPDRPVGGDTVVTVRGYGKFIVRSVSDLTKKGRYRLLADQYL